MAIIKATVSAAGIPAQVTTVIEPDIFETKPLDMVMEWVNPKPLEYSMTVPQNTLTPALTGDRLKEFQSGLRAANDATARTARDEALKSAGIPSLAALVAKMNASNVFDGAKATFQTQGLDGNLIAVNKLLSNPHKYGRAYSERAF